ncbi:hypothetical protein [Paenibacillus naphthalenovorans]|uniref:hypothetical protein n=1 Tax=Paenibacillus naphthalenovorans TaxID=162209 RepID=UPI003D2CCE5D
MTAERTLEFRGIPLEHLKTYLIELGAAKQTFEFPFVFQGPDWQANILSENQLRFTPVFIVNAVFIRFEASSQEALQHVIAAFRRKTFRAGG